MGVCLKIVKNCHIEPLTFNKIHVILHKETVAVAWKFSKTDGTTGYYTVPANVDESGEITLCGRA